MKPTRSVVLGVVAWLAVVAVGSTAVWLVISRAGEDVGAATQVPMRAAVTDAGRPTPRAQPTGPRPHRLHTSPASPSGQPTATSPSATASPRRSSPAAPAAQRRTWQGVGGYVTAQCRGSDISLVAAQPDAGFAIQVSDRGPETLEASFAGREDESGRHSEVKAVCVGGVPRFESHSEGAGGGDE